MELKEVKEVQVLTEDNELIASITDKNIIEKEGYKVVCVPESKQRRDKRELKRWADHINIRKQREQRKLSGKKNKTGSLQENS